MKMLEVAFSSSELKMGGSGDVVSDRGGSVMQDNLDDGSDTFSVAR